MYMVTKRCFRLGLVALTACSLVSCMDDKYDLDNVDLTVGTSGDLTLPQSSTGDILLSSFLDITDDGVIQLVDGEYFLVKNGDADVPRVDVNPISISRPVLSDMDVHVNIDPESLSPSRMHAAAAMPNRAGDFPVIHATYTYTIDPAEDDAYYMLPGNLYGTAPQEVISMDEVTFVDDTRLNVRMKAYFDEGYKFVNCAYLDNIALNIPLGLYVKRASLSYWTIENGVKKQVTVSDCEIDNENGLVKLTGRNCKILLGREYEMVANLDFEKAVVGLGACSFADHRVSLQGKFAVGGTFRIESDDFDNDQLTDEQKNTVISTGSYDAVCPRNLDVKGTSSFDKDIRLASFSGRMQSVVNKISPIKLNDLPDFLDDPEVELDLANPVFYVEVDNPMPAEIRTRLTLASNYTDGTPSVERKSGEIVLPAGMKCLVRVAENFDNLAMPGKYQGLRLVDVPIADLGALLKKLPDVINVDIDDILMDVNAMSVPQAGTDNYKVLIDYMVYTPLELGENTKLIYQGVEEGLADDLEDVNTLNTKAIEITAVAETNFPLDLTLSVDAQTENGESLVGTVVAVDDILIKAHKGSEEYSEQDVKLTILPLAGHTMSELLQNMDKFVYRAVAEGDGKLLENARIKLKDIRITLKGGVSYDAN